MTPKAMVIVAVPVLVLAGALWVALGGGGRAGFLPYDEPAVVARGEAVYRDYCAACHGAALEGEPNWRERDADGFLPAPPHDPSGHTWHHPDQQLFEITKFGTEAVVGGGYRSNMAAYADILSEAEIVAVLAYYQEHVAARDHRAAQLGQRAGCRPLSPVAVSDCPPRRRCALPAGRGAAGRSRPSALPVR